MFKHTVTRVKPNTDIKWAYQSDDRINVPKLFPFLTWVATESEDGLTRTIVRTAESSSTFTDFEAALADPTSDIYPVTQYYEQNGVTTTFTIEEV